MASSFPILFGAPGFGNEERDQWIRVLTLFLQDPFVGMAQSIGGNLTVNNGWKIPASAITGLDLTFKNNYNIRELNPFSESTAVSNGAQVEISDRPGVLFVFSEDASKAAVYGLSTSPSVWVSTGLTDWSSTSGTPTKTNIFYNGSNRWLIENLTGTDQNYYMLISSMGAQL